METTLRETDQGAIRCEHHVPMGSRLLIGSMLGFLASFFLYYLASGLIEYLRVATPAEWLAALPGFLVVLALFLLFGVPAWIAVAGRTWVVLDLQLGRLLEVRDLRVHRRTRSVPIAEVRDVSVARYKANYRIQIDLVAGKPITVGYEPTRPEADEIAQRLSSYLRVGATEPAPKAAGIGEDTP